MPAYQSGKPWFKAHACLVGEIASQMQAARREFAQPFERELHLVRAPRGDHLDRRAIEPRVRRTPVTIGVAGIVKQDEGFGMVIPLFVMALLWDKRPERMRSLRAKPIRIRLGRFMLATNTVNLLVAVGFVIMGILVIGQAGATEMTGADAPLVGMGAWLSEVFAWLIAITAPIPETVLGLALLALVAVFVVATLRDRRHAQPVASAHECCDTETSQTPAPEETETANKNAARSPTRELLVKYLATRKISTIEISPQRTLTSRAENSLAGKNLST